ncbi:MAG: hypothetical protein ABWY78_01985, partial [Microvirga sp.]
MAFSSTYSATPITVAKSISTAPLLQYNPGAVTVGAGKTAFFYQDTSGNLFGRLANGAADPTGGIVTVATGIDTSNNTKVTSATVLTNGNVVVTWASQGTTGDIYFRIYDANLNPLTDAISAETSGLSSRHPDVAALAGGGFVIAWEKSFSTTDHDVVFRQFDASGTGLGDATGTGVDTSVAYDEYPSVAGLADGGFALGFDRLASGNTTAWRAVREADGSQRLAATQFDNAGTVNKAIDVVALPNGQFLLNYEDSGWTGDASNTDVTAARFTAAGSFITFVRASNAANNDDHAFAAVSPDGFTIINSTNSNGSAYDIKAALL